MGPIVCIQTVTIVLGYFIINYSGQGCVFYCIVVGGSFIATTVEYLSVDGFRRGVSNEIFSWARGALVPILLLVWIDGGRFWMVNNVVKTHGKVNIVI